MTDSPSAIAPASGFASLGVSPDLVAALAARGITDPFPVQTMTIPDGLAGRDVCGKAQTGSGKTLAFGIPLIERTARAGQQDPHGLVVVPTRELCVQVAEALRPLAASRRLRLAVAQLTTGSGAKNSVIMLPTRAN